jgi:hypothetical protein
MDLSPEKYRHDLAIIRDTAAQIIRDFSIHGVEIQFSGNELTAWTELHNQITPVLAGMFAHNKSGFMALLYQIDVSERKFREALEEGGKDEFNSRLAELIIQREFQKVLTRRFFSEKR